MMRTHPTRINGTVLSKTVFLPNLSVKYPVGTDETAAPIGISDPMIDNWCKLTGKPADSSSSSGPAGDVQAKAAPNADAERHAET